MIRYFTIKARNKDVELMAKVVNQGIDSRLEAFTKSKFYNSDGYNHVDCDIHSSEMSILLRRLDELEDERADSLANGIIQVYYDKEII